MRWVFPQQPPVGFEQRQCLWWVLNGKELSSTQEETCSTQEERFVSGPLKPFVYFLHTSTLLSRKHFCHLARAGSTSTRTPLRSVFFKDCHTNIQVLFCRDVTTENILMPPVGHKAEERDPAPFSPRDKHLQLPPAAFQERNRSMNAPPPSLSTGSRKTAGAGSSMGSSDPGKHS